MKYEEFYECEKVCIDKLYMLDERMIEVIIRVEVVEKRLYLFERKVLKFC